MGEKKIIRFAFKSCFLGIYLDIKRKIEMI